MNYVYQYKNHPWKPTPLVCDVVLKPQIRKKLDLNSIVNTNSSCLLPLLRIILNIT